MSKNSKDIENNKFSNAELEAYRIGEEQDIISNDESMSLSDKQVIEDLDKILKFFSQARPDPDNIPESLDNIILGHVKEKSREIRRARKVVRLFPRWKWAAAAVMGVLVCVVTFNIFRSEISENNTFKDNIAPMSSEISKDIDGNGRIDIIDAYIMDRRLMSGGSMPQKLDLNGDGYINHEDMVAIANSAVSLGRRDI
jgi:hypothetical protein